jgi:hypothetical protein
MRTPDHVAGEDLVGAEIVFGATPLGHVEAVLRDPVSRRVRRMITSYGANRRQVAVPMEWVVRRTQARVTIGVGTRSLDDLPTHVDVGYDN